MKKNNSPYSSIFSAPKLLLLLCCLVFSLQAQEPKKIRFVKDRQYIYFFQTGAKCDTLKTAEDRLFYFLVPDSLKRFIVLQSENANFATTANDSVLRCNYVPGVRYETFYTEVVGELGHNDVDSKFNNDLNYALKAKTEKMVLRCGANGAAVVPPKKIQFVIVDKRYDRVILENVFFAP